VIVTVGTKHHNQVDYEAREVQKITDLQCGPQGELD